MLEGLYSAFGEDSAAQISQEGIAIELSSEKLRLANLLEQAKLELAIENVFGRQCWTEDGWRFKVEVSGDGQESKGGDWVLVGLSDKHALLEKWSELTRREMARMGVGAIFGGIKWENWMIANEGSLKTKSGELNEESEEKV